MPLGDQLKNYAKKLVEHRPQPAQLRGMVRRRKPTVVMFADDGIIPNNPRFSLIVYRGAINLSNKSFDPPVIIDALFSTNGWGRSWRDTIYDFVHYHSQIHEVLGVARGNATVEFGGVKGRKLRLKAGDIAIVPAGTGHRLIKASRNFLVVGAYPPSGKYDECTKSEEHARALKTIPKVGRPRKDPVYGFKGPLLESWKPVR